MLDEGEVREELRMAREKRDNTPVSDPMWDMHNTRYWAFKRVLEEVKE